MSATSLFHAHTHRYLSAWYSGLSTDSLIPTTDAWLALGMTCDVILAYVVVISVNHLPNTDVRARSVLLYMHLMKSKTGFQSAYRVALGFHANQ